MKRPKNSGKNHQFDNKVKTGFFSHLIRDAQIHFYLIMFMLAAYANGKLSDMLFDGKGIGSILNQISDGYIIFISISICISYLIKTLKN